jgi:hypothetical protein
MSSFVVELQAIANLFLLPVLKCWLLQKTHMLKKPKLIPFRILLKHLQPLTVQGTLSAVMSQSIVWYKFTDASERPNASILTVDGGSSYHTTSQHCYQTMHHITTVTVAKI